MHSIKVNLNDLNNWIKQIKRCSDILPLVFAEYKKYYSDTFDLYSKAKTHLEQQNDRLISETNQLNEKEQRINAREHSIRSDYLTSLDESRRAVLAKELMSCESEKENIRNNKEIIASQYWQVQEWYQQLLYYERELETAYNFGNTLHNELEELQNTLINIVRLIEKIIQEYFRNA